MAEEARKALVLLKDKRYQLLAGAWESLEKRWHKPPEEGIGWGQVNYLGIQESTGLHPRLVLEGFRALKQADLVTPLGLADEAATFLKALHGRKKKYG